ncbi:MAG: hypothetical protein RLZZ373_359, partial [Pseudomonadota bacterium]
MWESREAMVERMSWACCSFGAPETSISPSLSEFSTT